MVNEATEIQLSYEVLCIIIIMSLFISLVCNKCDANAEASLNFKLIHFNVFYSGVGFFFFFFLVVLRYRFCVFSKRERLCCAF